MKELVFNVKYNGFNYNINLDDKKVLKENYWEKIINNQYLSFPRTASIDLLVISQVVFYCDRKFTRNTGNDGWKRIFDVIIPVMNLALIEKQKELIEKMLKFLTGDEWIINFIGRNLTEQEKITERFLKDRNEFKVNEVCMFSGGLDSFIGASDLLANQNNNSFFVSHYGGGKGTIEFQNALKKKLVDEYSECSEDRFFQFYLAVQGGKEETTRSRSFLFFSHAIALADTLNAKSLIIPENGYISLNVPLTHARYGSSSTRTTHPYYFKLLQDLILNLGMTMKIENPYRFMTKGEMIVHTKNKEFLRRNISNTMSCSHPDQGRYQQLTEAQHCGYCLPCTIRRASIIRAYGNDSTIYRIENYDSPEAKQNHNALKIALYKNEGVYSELQIQKNGIVEEGIKEYSLMYEKGNYELKNFIEILDV